MVTKKILSTLAALIVMLLLLPSLVLAQETPITAAEIAGYWVGDFYRGDGEGDNLIEGAFHLEMNEDGTGIFESFSLYNNNIPVNYSNGNISGSQVQEGERRYLDYNHELVFIPYKYYVTVNLTVSRYEGEIIMEGKYTSVNVLDDEDGIPYEWSLKTTRKEETVATKEPTEEGPFGEDDIPVLIDPTSEATQTPAPTPSPTPRRRWPFQTEETPQPSIVRFGDLYGEVNVRPNDEDDDAYIFAELSTPLHHNDRIRTLTRSGAILSFSDMSTFVMKEDTIIVLDIANEYESKIKLVAGNVWTNLKKMWSDGSMEIEMSQAVCGIKATTLIIEETDNVSTLKVLEGEVEFTSKATGEVEYVGGGQMISADKDGLGEIEPFDIEEEMKGWHETARQITAAEINKNSVIRIVFVIIGVALALGAIILLIIVVSRRVRNRNRYPISSTLPYYVPNHCNRCGNSLSPDNKFCPACGAPRPASYNVPLHCSRCGNTLSPDSKFCPACGAPVQITASNSYR